MIIKRGKVFQEDGNFLEQTLYVNDHRLVDKAEYQDDGEVIDAEGLDIQITSTESDTNNGSVPALFANIPIKDMRNSDK